MSEFDAILAIGATTVLLLGVVSGYVRNPLWISERVSGLTASVALALATVAWVHLVGSSGILAAFVAGLVFHRFLVRVEDPRIEHVQEAISRFFDLPVFVLFDLSVPWRDWLALDWTAWGSFSRRCCCAIRNQASRRLPC